MPEQSKSQPTGDSKSLSLATDFFLSICKTLGSVVMMHVCLQNVDNMPSRACSSPRNATTASMEGGRVASRYYDACIAHVIVPSGEYFQLHRESLGLVGKDNLVGMLMYKIRLFLTVWCLLFSSSTAFVTLALPSHLRSTRVQEVISFVLSSQQPTVPSGPTIIMKYSLVLSLATLALAVPNDYKHTVTVTEYKQKECPQPHCPPPITEVCRPTACISLRHISSALATRHALTISDPVQD